MKTLSPEVLKKWIAEGKLFVLIDVREDDERKAYNIGGIHIPMGEIMVRKEELKKTMPHVFYCEKGIRSSIIIQRLEGLGFENLYNLSGGMHAWKMM